MQHPVNIYWISSTDDDYSNGVVIKLPGNGLPETSTPSTPQQYRWESKSWVDFDDVLPHLGRFGCYQIFLAAEPSDYWCRIPAFDGANMTQQTKWRLSTPFSTVQGKEAHSKCTMYDVNYTELLTSGSQEPNVSWPVVPCKHGWVYDRSIYQKTVVIQWDLVCDKGFYPTVALTVNYFGIMVGVALFGYVNDKLGRRRSFFIIFANMIIFGILTAFAPEFVSWTIFRFFVGLSSVAIFQNPFVVVLELLPPEKRRFFAGATFPAFEIGYMVLALIVYLIRDWVTLALVTVLPFLMFIIYWCIMPESPRWLIVHERYNQLTDLVTKMARSNRVTVDAKDLVNRIEQINHRALSSDRDRRAIVSSTVADLFKYPRIRRHVVLSTIIWVICAIIFVGLILFTPALHPNPILAFFLLGLVDIPAYVILWFTLDLFGRRGILFTFLLMSSACSFAMVSVSADYVTAKLVLALLSKFSVTLSFATIYVYLGELYPTVIRGIAIAFHSGMAQLFLTILPAIVFLGRVDFSIPMQTLAAMGCVGAMAVIFLPETTNAYLPETIEESENFKPQKGFKRLILCVCCNRQRIK